MVVKNSKQLTILKRRRDVADLYLQGWNQTAIAEELGVAQPTISDDVKHIRAEWRDSAVRDFDEARQLELMKLDRIEREAWSAFDQSKKPAQSAVVTGEGYGQKTRKSMKNQHGDPRFLDQVNKCITHRRALLGLDAPMQLTEDGADELSVDVRRDRIVAVFAALRERAGTGATGTGPGAFEPRHASDVTKNSLDKNVWIKFGSSFQRRAQAGSERFSYATIVCNPVARSYLSRFKRCTCRRFSGFSKSRRSRSLCVQRLANRVEFLRPIGLHAEPISSSRRRRPANPSSRRL